MITTSQCRDEESWSKTTLRTRRAFTAVWMQCCGAASGPLGISSLKKKHNSAPRGAQSMLPAPPQALFRFKQACHVCRYLPWEALPWAYRSLWATRPKGFDQNKWRNEIIKSPLTWPSPFPCSSVLGRRGLSFPPGYQNSPALLQCCYSWDEAAKLDWSQGCQVSG